MNYPQLIINDTKLHNRKEYEMFGLFRKKKPRTLLDDFNDTVVKLYRPLIKKNHNIKDAQILEIVQTVMKVFKEASERRGEDISGVSLNKIASKFVVVYDTLGEEFYLEHLKYEVSLYIESGLRDDYK